jgi:hypothetical protein
MGSTTSQFPSLLLLRHRLLDITDSAQRDKGRSKDVGKQASVLEPSGPQARRSPTEGPVLCLKHRLPSSSTFWVTMAHQKQ